MVANQIAMYFNNDESKLRIFTRSLFQYNQVLDSVYQTIIKAIAEKYMGKKIDKRFANYINPILTEVFGLTKEGLPRVYISVENADWVDEKIINIVIEWDWRTKTSIESIITRYHKFARNQYVQESTVDNCFNMGSIEGLVRDINRNREMVTRYLDASKNFKKYIAAYKKAKDRLIASLQKINPMFYDDVIPTYHLGKTPHDDIINQSFETFVYMPDEAHI